MHFSRYIIKQILIFYRADMLVKKAEDAERKRQHSDLHLLYELERKLEQSALQKIGRKSQSGFEALDQYRLTSLERLGRKKVILVAT